MSKLSSAPRSSVSGKYLRKSSANVELEIFRGVVSGLKKDHNRLRKIAIDAGISTPSGKLTKAYAGQKINTGSRYELLPSFLLCFHGTDTKTAEAIFAGKAHLKPSENDYDWLGHGIYFWEYSPQRAYQFAQEKFNWQKKKDKVAVVGAIIDPGLCFNLLDASSLGFLEYGYDALLEDRGGVDFLPKNGDGKELWKRQLDCAVINMVHQIRSETQTDDWIKKNPGKPSLAPYDTVRGAFWEGGPIYDGARIEKKNHVQICVRNPNAIKGYFRPIAD